MVCDHQDASIRSLLHAQNMQQYGFELLLKVESGMHPPAIPRAGRFIQFIRANCKQLLVAFCGTPLGAIGVQVKCQLVVQNGHVGIG